MKQSLPDKTTTTTTISFLYPSTMDPTFTLLPLSMDSSSKAISCPSLPSNDPLTTALGQINTLHRTLLSLPATPGQASNTTPPPPTAVNPKRSNQIQKMREQANTAMKKASGNPNQAQGLTLCPQRHIHLPTGISYPRSPVLIL